MAEVLVLAEHTADGEVKKVTLELLTAARRLGEPSVVWTGPGADAAQPRLAEYGAAKVYVADSPDFAGYVVAPAAELLASLVASASPAAVLIAGTTEGKEIAGRLAVKTGSGVLTDAVDVTAGAGRPPLADQPNFRARLRRGQDGEGHRARGGRGERAAGAVGGLDRGLRRPRHRVGGRVRHHREAGGLPRGGRRRVPRGSGRGP